MTDHCGFGSCKEDRMSGTPYCTSHWSLVPGKLQTQFRFVLGRMLKFSGTPRGEAAARDLHSIRLNVAEAIQEALDKRREV